MSSQQTQYVRRILPLAVLLVAITACSSPTDPGQPLTAEQADQDRLESIAQQAQGWSDEDAQRAESQRLQEVMAAYEAEHPDHSAEEDALASSGVLPADLGSLLVRTDFSHQPQWEALVEALETPSPEGFMPYLRVIEHGRWEGASTADVAAEAPDVLIVVADATTFSAPEMPLLVLEVTEGATRELRATPAALWSVENNLSIANMDWEEFSEAADPDGVFRGFN